jgi:hypothetical protein
MDAHFVPCKDEGALVTAKDDCVRTPRNTDNERLKAEHERQTLIDLLYSRKAK